MVAQVALQVLAACDGGAATRENDCLNSASLIKSNQQSQKQWG